MKLIDISVPLHAGLAVYEGDPRFEILHKNATTPGVPGTYNLSRMTLNTHIGTHVDPPLHFVHGGKSITDLDLAALCGPARVLDLRGRGHAIDASLLKEKNLSGVERLLLRTDNEAYIGDAAFHKNYAHLTPDAAAYLRRDIGLRLIGIDYLSVDPFPVEGEPLTFPAHHVLMDPDPARPPVVILEGIDLREAEEGDYELFCLPLKIQNGDGAPARAVLRRL